MFKHCSKYLPEKWIKVLMQQMKVACFDEANL